MSNESAGYDAIGSKYDDYSSTATLKRAERHSFLRMVGDVRGLRVLDLACGTGFYTRLLKQCGAESVLGVDLSPEMVEVARRHEQEQPTGVEYRVDDAGCLPTLGSFDLVAAVWLLNYARTREEMRGMLASAYANLAPGGRLVAYTLNPAHDFRRSDFSKYGVRIKSEVDKGDRAVCEGEFVLDPPAPVTVYRWSRSAYEEMIGEAGFTELSWRPSEVAPADLAARGDEYWRDFLDNCIGIGLVCRR